MNEPILTQEPAETQLVGSRCLTLAPDSSVGFSIRGTNNRRRAAVVSNHDVYFALVIVDSRGNCLGMVQPGTAYPIESGDDFAVWNRNPSASVNCSVCEYLLKFSSRPEPKAIRGSFTVAY